MEFRTGASAGRASLIYRAANLSAYRLFSKNSRKSYMFSTSRIAWRLVGDDERKAIDRLERRLEGLGDEAGQFGLVMRP